MAKKKSNKKTKRASVPKTQVAVKRPVLSIVWRFLLICLLVGITIYVFDKKGVYDPDEKNNHTKKKWNSIYEFTEKNPIDVLLIGNSHLYTGFNPKNLSTRLGLNAFIIASPGTHIGDSYFALKEAIQLSKPKVVVVETYGINEFNPYELEGQELSDQFKSFAARKDVSEKMKSTPYLFESKNYGYAWSNMLRNHDYLLNNYEQIETNLEKDDRSLNRLNKELYLGRYVRFTSGLEDSVLNLYDSLGAPVDGKEYTWNQYAKDYTDKIVSLCESKGIQVVFYTIPMYRKHVKNYQHWKSKLGEIVEPHEKSWLDLQQNKYNKNYGPECFENTYSNNQHLTYNGSLKATYDLASFLEEQIDELPDRSNEKSWHEVFYGEEGYFQHFSPRKGDSKNITFAANVDLGPVQGQEVIYFKKNKRRILQLKIPKKDFNLPGRIENYAVQTAITFKAGQQSKRIQVQLNYDQYHENPDHYIFHRALKPIRITAFNGAKLIKTN